MYFDILHHSITHALGPELLLCFLQEGRCHKLSIIPDKTPPKVCKRYVDCIPESKRIYITPVRWEVIYLEDHGKASSCHHHPQLPAWRMSSNTSPNCPCKKLSNAHGHAHFHVQTCKTCISSLSKDWVHYYATASSELKATKTMVCHSMNGGFWPMYYHNQVYRSSGTVCVWSRMQSAEQKPWPWQPHLSH